MDLLHLVDRLEELVDGAQKLPIGNRAMIDRRRLLDLVDQMRVAIPEEVRQAQEMVARREELRREAEEEARIIVARAEEQAARRVEEHAVTEDARARAAEMAKQADDRLEQRIAEANQDVQRRMDESSLLIERQMTEADEYATALLRRLERQLEAFTRSVRSGLDQLDAESARVRANATSEADAATAVAEQQEQHPAAGEPELVPAGAVAQTQASTTRPGTRPVPLHQDSEGAPATDERDELEDLLARRPEPIRRPPSEGGAAVPESAEADLIDDFALPHLDDEPAREGPEREGGSPEPRQ